MQTVSKGDEFAAARVNGCEKRCPFGRFRTRGAKEALLKIPWGYFGEFFCEIHEVFRQVNVADVLQCFNLCDDLFRDLGVAVTTVDDGDSSETVEILPALAVKEILHGAAHDLAGLAVEVTEAGHDILLLFFEDGFSANVFFQIIPS